MDITPRRIRPRPWPSYEAMLVDLAATLRTLPRDEVQLYARACWEAGFGLDVEAWRPVLKAELAKSDLSIHMGLLVYALRTYAEAANLPVLTATCLLALRGDKQALAAVIAAVEGLAKP